MEFIFHYQFRDTHQLACGSGWALLRNMRRTRRTVILGVLVLFFSFWTADKKLIAEEFIGFGNVPIRGGLGGKILRVTNLNADGPGSLAAALRYNGKRVIVFEVGGVIDLKGRSLVVPHPRVTIAGQTAPSPGITLIRGGLDILTHDVVVQHLRIRVGSAGKKKGSGWEVDAIGLNRAHRVVVDHCSLTWATDENLSASGPRFRGKSLIDWRNRTSHDVTFSNNIIAEGLSNATHAKGEHSKGTLLHDNVTNVVVVGNLYACNVERNPLAKGGVHAVVVNNWISNPGKRAIHHGLNHKEWGERKPVTSRLAIVGNVVEHGPNTTDDVAVFENQRESPLELYLKDNIAYDRKNQMKPELKGKVTKNLEEPPLWPTGFKALPVRKVRQRVAAEAGARPWDRDEVDSRIVQVALDRVGKIIHHEKDVGGYPKPKTTFRKFDPENWDMLRLVPLK